MDARRRRDRGRTCVRRRAVSRYERVLDGDLRGVLREYRVVVGAGHGDPRDHYMVGAWPDAYPDVTSRCINRDVGYLVMAARDRRRGQPRAACGRTCRG